MFQHVQPGTIVGVGTGLPPHNFIDGPVQRKARLKGCFSLISSLKTGKARIRCFDLNRQPAIYVDGDINGHMQMISYKARRRP